MPIPRDEAGKFLEASKLRYGGILIETTFDSDYSSVDIFSEELPVGKKEQYDRAKAIGKELGLNLIYQDFSFGEGENPPDYQLVFVSTCKTLEEVLKAPEIIAEGIYKVEKII